MGELIKVQDLCSIGYSICPETLHVDCREDKDTYCISLRNDGHFNIYMQLVVLGLLGVSKFFDVSSINIHLNPKNYRVIAVSVCDSVGNKFIISKCPKNKVDYTIQRVSEEGCYTRHNIDDKLFILAFFSNLVNWKQVIRTCYPKP